MAAHFTTLYPNIACFVDGAGWIEVGYDGGGYQTSFLRALDEGGMVWEGRDKYESLDAAFQDMDAALGAWMTEMGISRK